MSAAPVIVRDLAQRQAEPEYRPNSQAESSDERTSTPIHEDVAMLAYALWQQRGCPADSAESDWLEAEQQLRQASQQRPAVNEA